VRRETGDGRRETGDGRRETGDGRRETDLNALTISRLTRYFIGFNLLKTALYLLMFITIFIVQPALGNELKLAPSVTLKEQYNDNIFFSVNDRKSDFISILTPGIELSDRSERLDANLLLRLNGILYAQTSGLSAVDQDYQGRLRYMLSPGTRLSTQAGYTLDSQPDREIATTGLVLGAVKRHRQQYSISGERALTERTSAALAYSYEQDDYDNQRFSDLKYHDASLTFTHDLDRLMRATKGSANFDYTHYKSSSSTTVNVVPGLIRNLFYDSTVDNFSATIGGSRAFNEVWSVQANVGGRYTVSNFQTSDQLVILQTSYNSAPVKQTSRQWGWVGQLALSYKGELTDGSLAFNTDVQPASGQTSGTTVRTGLVADMRRRFTYELSGSMSVGYYLNKSNPGAIAGQAINEETVLVTPGIRYEFDKDTYLEASYQYATVFNNIFRNEAGRNTFFVRFYVQHPFFM
jgi:hypothetical protein